MMLCRHMKKEGSPVLLQILCRQCYRIKLVQIIVLRNGGFMNRIFPLFSTSCRYVGTSVPNRTPARSLLFRLLYLIRHRDLCLTVTCLFQIILKLIVLAAFIPTTRKIMGGGGLN